MAVTPHLAITSVLQMIVLGPPVFVYQNSAIQYGVIGKKVTIRLYILSYSKIECIAVRAVDGVVDVNYVHDTYKKPLKVLDIFHGQIISVNGIEVEFVFARLEQKHFRIYRITVCNTFGNESYTFSLVPRGKWYDLYDNDSLSRLQHCPLI